MTMTAKPIKIQPRQVLFGFIFLLVFCFSGLLSITSIITGWFAYRNGITVSLLAIPIALLFGIKFNKVTIAFIVLAGVIILSGFYNQSTPQQVLVFLRNVIFSFLIYNLVQVCIRTDNIKQVIKWCVIIAVIQLPIVLFQQAIYPQLPGAVHSRIVATDIGTGTFDINGDAAMAFFLVLMIIFLLFDSKRNYFIQGKWLVLPWLTLTIFIAQAELLKLIVLFVWGVFFLVRFKSKKLFYILLIMVIIIGGMAAFGVFDATIARMTRRVEGSLDTSKEATEKFLAGEYSRGAAINYYLHRGILLLGDGPSKYYEAQTRQKLVGNNGHLLTFYSEVGLLGWMGSVLIFFLIAFSNKQKKHQISWSQLLNFGSLMLITITSFVMDNTALMLIYCIMAMTSMIPEKIVSITNGEGIQNNAPFSSGK